MSDDSQIPTNPPSGNLTDFSKDFTGLDETDLWELDGNPTQPQNQNIPTEKNDETVQNDVPSVDVEIPSNQPEITTNSPSFFKTLTTLTTLEKVSLLAITAALIISASLAIVHFSREIPVDSRISKKVSLPVEGEILSVSTVETFWRKPITQGENPDIVRRGIKLIPVVKIQAKGSSGAIRVFFRNSEGTLVGDSTTLAISGEKTHQISATDGFTDTSMHAAYRTGDSPRWMIQAFEGPSVDAPIKKFILLFETEISTNTR